MLDVHEIYQISGKHCRKPLNFIQKRTQVKRTRRATMPTHSHRQHWRQPFRKVQHQQLNGSASPPIAKSAVTAHAKTRNLNWSIRKMEAANSIMSRRQSSSTQAVAWAIGVSCRFLPFKMISINWFFWTVNCTIWDGRETKKAEMSVLDISSAIIERVEAIPETCDYIYIGLAFSIVLSLVPAFCRLCEVRLN